MLEAETVSNFFKSIDSLLKEFSTKKLTSEIHNTLKVLYSRISQCNLKYKISFGDLVQEQQNALISLLQHLSCILCNSVYPVDLLLLCGTCVSVLIAGLFHPYYASSLFIFLYCSFGKPTPDFLLEKDEIQLHKVLSLNLVEDEDFINNLNDSMHGMAPSFSQIAVLHGMLSYQNSDIFLFSSKLHKDIPFLISLFEYICSMCSSPCCSQYHAFSVLLSWLKTCEKYLPKVLHSKPEAIFSSGTSFVVTKTLCLLESNLESPVKGVTTFVKECYRLLIHLSQSEGELLNRQDFDMVNFLLDQTMKLSWQIKGKYVILSVLLQFVDYKKYLTNYPEVPMAVVINMKAGYASSAVSEVYKSIVSVIRNTNPSEDVILNEWGRWWKKPILDSLNSENKSLVQNVVNLILPWTMKAIPKSYEFLLESETQVFAQLILQRVAKESGVHSLQEKEIKILMTHLHHYEIRIRAEILSTLCCSSKKSEAVSEEELNILKDFILVNLNIDSTSFQQLLLAQMRTLLVRIRDSLVQQYRLMPKDNPGICFGHSEIGFEFYVNIWN